MVKTMLAALFLGALSMGDAQSGHFAEGDKAQCAIDGVAAVDDLSDAALFVWAASKRCGKSDRSQVACEIDITSAAQGASNMIATIVGAVADCGGITTESAKCAAAVTDLTGAAAGLAAASGEILGACPNSFSQVDIDKYKDDGTDGADGTNQKTILGVCIVDAKDAMGSLFSASKYLSKAANCGGKNGKNGGCTNTALNIVMALADMGSNLAASVSDCAAVKGVGNANAYCASAVLALVSGLHEVALAGKKIKKGCKHAGRTSRLYENTEEVPTSSSSLTLALAAFLPVTAMLSFVVGRRTRSHHQQASERDVERLMVEELAM